MEDHGFLDTLQCTYTSVCSNHADYSDGTNHACMRNYGLPMQAIQNVTQIRFFRSWALASLNWENFY